MSSFDETIELFQENLEWLNHDELWRRVSLTLGQMAALRERYSRVVLFDPGKRVFDPGAIVSDAGWAVIVSAAEDTLAKLVVNDCRIRPSIA